MYILNKLPWEFARVLAGSILDCVHPHPSYLSFSHFWNYVYHQQPFAPSSILHPQTATVGGRDGTLHCESSG